MAKDDNTLLILEKLSEVATNQGRLEGKFEALSSDVRAIEEQDKEQNRLLAEHIEGVRTNKERLEEEKAARRASEKIMNQRLSALEIDPQFWKTLKNKLLTAAAIAGGLLTILKLFNAI